VQRFSRQVVPNGKRVKDQTFGFDRIFDDNTSQGEVYEATTRNLLDSVLDGYNATVFAYGATGCGKTHTITGTAQEPGIIFLTMQELFEKISDIAEEKVTEISLSYLEIYNETIRDLLVPGGSKAGLMLREDANQAVSVAGLSSHHPQNVQEVMDMIMRGNEYRTISPTEANATSSRSHAVLQINVSQKDRNADVNEPHTMATLSIIDLAGSERASATKNRGERLTEGANINKSLLALGSCINALCDPRRRNHVPYRNSKLTRLLKFSLGGNCKTVMIVCVSPSSQHFDETQNTLRYANRAKNIQTKVTRNVYNVNRHVKDFLVKIDEQRALIDELKQQQKDHEALAFTKFKKQGEKREIIAREGILRIRTAYENSAQERQERINSMSKLRQVGKRIALLSSWIAAFDTVCDNHEDEEPLRNLQAIRKTAQGILVELEGSRQHYHQRLAKSNWDRAINSALEHGVRQLKDVDSSDCLEAANLARETELFRSTAEREALSAMADQEKNGEAPLVQVLLQAQFETIAAVENIMHLSEGEAISMGRKILSKMLTDCVGSASNVVKPDGSFAAVEAFPPTKAGTPKRRKPVSDVAACSPPPMRPNFNPALAVAPHLSASPMKASPRRKKFGGARKGVSFSPKKKTPIKRAVRWRDDEEGTLAEFEKTPQRFDSTPEISSNEPAVPPVVTSMAGFDGAQDSTDSSPIPAPPESSIRIHTTNNRFKAGFLAKKTDGSPLPPTLTNLSDSDQSPLRDLEPGKTQNRSSLNTVNSASPDLAPIENHSNSSSDNEDKFSTNRSDATKINSAIKRTSSMHSGNQSIPNNRTQRRRSPTATASSPPNESAMFTAGHARRMVKSEKENDWKSVLSPRTAPIVKGPAHAQRRTTLGDNFVRPREVTGMREGVRLSSTAQLGGSAARTSLIGGKGAWR
jgi:kinesin family member 18/19